MSALANLKLVSAKRPTQLPPIVQRRNKVAKRIWEQIELANAQATGSSYAPTRLRTVTEVETGLRKTISVPKRVKQWWFVAENGKVCVTVRYGAKIIALGNKGQTAVELSNADQLVQTLETLKSAVEAGELDTAIDAVAGTAKLNFAKGSVVRAVKDVV